VAAEAGVIQLANTQTPAHKGQFEAQTIAPVMPNSKLHCHASNRDVLRSIRTIQRRCAGQQNGAIAKK
jgi:hypothetical protein